MTARARQARDVPLALVSLLPAWHRWLVSPLFPCVAREQEMEEALVLLEQHAPFVALVGPRGVGKTTILRALLRSRPASYGPATVVLCSGDASISGVLEHIADALGLAIVPGLSLARLRVLIGAKLDDEPAVLALDDLPTSLPELGDIVADWLAVAPGLRVVATSVAPLSGAQSVVINPLRPEQARKVLAAAIHRRNPTRSLPGGQIEEGVRLAGGLFLALEVVASHLASVGSISPQGGTWSALEATLRYVLEGLSPSAVQAAHALAVFDGEFSGRAAQAVLREHEAGDAAVTELHRASLLDGPFHIEDPDHSRLRLLEPLRRVLTPSREVARRHAEYFASLQKPKASDLPEIRRALYFWGSLEEAGGAERLVEAVILLDDFLIRVAAPGEHLGFLDLADALVRGSAERAALGRARGRVYALHGRAREAVQAFDEALRWEQPCASLSRTLAMQCFALRAAGERGRAAVVGQEALKMAEQARMPGLLAMALQVLGLVAHDEQRYEEAERCFALGEAHAQRPEDARVASICAANRAASLLELGDLQEANACWGRAARGFECLEDSLHRRRIGWMEAALLRGRGELENAAQLAAQLRLSLSAMGDDRGELDALLEMLRIAKQRGESEKSEALAAEVRWLVEQVGDAPLQRCAERVFSAPIFPTSARKPRRVLCVAHRGGVVRQISLDGHALELGRRGPLLRILLGMAEAPGRTFSVTELQALGWPGERMSADSGAARVYMTVRRLRAFGLGESLVTEASGYRLHDSLEVNVDALS